MLTARGCAQPRFEEGSRMPRLPGRMKLVYDSFLAQQEVRERRDGLYGVGAGLYVR